MASDSIFKDGTPRKNVSSVRPRRRRSGWRINLSLLSSYLTLAFHDIIPAFTHLRKSYSSAVLLQLSSSSRPLSLTFLHVGTLRRSCLSNFYTQTESCFLNLEQRSRRLSSSSSRQHESARKQRRRRRRRVRLRRTVYTLPSPFEGGAITF